MRCALLLSLGLLACSGGSTTTPAAPTPAPTVPSAPAAAPTPTPTPVPAAQRPAPRMRAASQLRLFHEARRAARVHDYTTALDRFDQMLREAPRSPRLACEAGFVAHQAGRDDLAEPRIELALRGFGPDERLSPELRVPAAMCLYNAGLVYEARGDRDAAAGVYDRSLRLRPNDAVRARRAALGASDGDEADGDALVVRAASEAELVEVLERTFAGESWDGELAYASVERVGELALPADGVFAHALLFSVNDHAAMLEDISYVVALERRAGGYVLFATDAGFVDTQENGSNDTSDAALGSIVVDHGLLRIDFAIVSSNETQNEHAWEEHPDYTCYEISSGPDDVLDATLLCALSSPACVRIDRGTRVNGRATSDVICVDAEGEDVEGPELAPDASSGDSDLYEARIEVADGPTVRVVPISGSLPEPRLAGEHTWSVLVGLDVALDQVQPVSGEDDEEDDE
jgi:hypothetical protein